MTTTFAPGDAVRIRSIAVENAEAQNGELDDDVGRVDHIKDDGDVFVERLFQHSPGVYTDNCVGNGWIAEPEDLEHVTLVAGQPIAGKEGFRLSTWTVA